LGCLVLGHPKPFGESDLNLRFVRASFRFLGRAAHDKSARRTPAEPNTRDEALVSSLHPLKRGLGERRQGIRTEVARGGGWPEAHVSVFGIPEPRVLAVKPARFLDREVWPAPSRIIQAIPPVAGKSERLRSC